MSADQTSLDQLIEAVGEGDLTARDRLVALLYDDLRRAAAGMMLHQRPDHTLQPSALVHEALLKLLSHDTFREVHDKAHFYHAVVQVMRQVLIDHHRHRVTRKGVGQLQRHPLDAVIDRLTRHQTLEIEALDEALDHLARVDSRACLVTTFHGFLGMSLPEVADILEISVPTVERDWVFARAWLRDRLKPEPT